MADMTPNPMPSVSGDVTSAPEPTDRELDELLGAFALNAVDATEADQIDAYLRRSPRARSEVSDHLEVAAALGSLAGEHHGQLSNDVPQRLWESIVGKLPERAPIVDREAAILTFTRPELTADRSVDATPAATRVARSRWRTAATAMLVAASVTAVSGLTAVVIRQGSTINELEGQVAAAKASDIADDVILQRVLSAPGTQVVRLTDANGSAVASIALASNGTGYVFGSTLPPLPSGTTYQLWGVSDGIVLSLGIFGADPVVAPFAASGRYSQLVMTAESGPGVVASTSKAVASATLS